MGVRYICSTNDAYVSRVQTDVLQTESVADVFECGSSNFGTRWFMRPLTAICDPGVESCKVASAALQTIFDDDGNLLLWVSVLGAVCLGKRT